MQDQQVTPAAVEAPVRRTMWGLTESVARGFQNFDKPEGQASVRGAYQALGAIESWGRDINNPSAPDVGGAASMLRREIRAEIAKRTGVASKLRDELIANAGAIAGLADAGPEAIKPYAEQRAKIEAQIADISEGVQGFRREGSWNPLALIPGGDNFLGGPTDVKRVVTSKGFFNTVDADAFYMDPRVALTEVKPEDMRTGALRGYIASVAPILEENGKRYVDTPAGTFHLSEFDRVYANRKQLVTSLLGMDPNTVNETGWKAFSQGLTGDGSIVGALIKRGTKMAAGDDEPNDGYLWNVRTAAPGLRLPYLPDLFGDGNRDRTWRFLQTPTGAATVRGVIEKMQTDGELHPSWGQVLGQLTGFTLETAGVGKLVGAAAGASAGAITSQSRLPLAASKVRQLQTWWGAAAEESNWAGLRFGLRGMTDMTAQSVVKTAIDGEGTFKEATLRGIGDTLPFVLTNSFLARPLRKIAQRIVGSVAPHLALRGTQATSDDIVRFIDSLPSKSIDLQREVQKIVTQPALAQGIGHTVDNAATMWLMGSYHSAVSDNGAKWDSMPVDAKALEVMRHMNSTEALGGMVFGGTSGAMMVGNEMRKLRGKFGDLTPEMQAHVTSLAYNAMKHFAEPNDPAKFEGYVRTFDALRKANPDYPFSTIEPWSPHENWSSSMGVRQQAAAMDRPMASTMASFSDRMTKDNVAAISKRWTGVRVSGYDENGNPTYRDRAIGEPGTIIVPKLSDLHSLGVKAIGDGRYVIVDPYYPERIYGDTPVWDTPVGAMIQAEAISRDLRARSTPQPIDEVPRLKKPKKGAENPPNGATVTPPGPKPKTPKQPKPPKGPIADEPLFKTETAEAVKRANERGQAERELWERARRDSPSMMANKYAKDPNWRQNVLAEKLDPKVEADTIRILEQVEEINKITERRRARAAAQPRQTTLEEVRAPTHEEQRATAEAHALDPQHLGKVPDEVVAEVNAERAVPEGVEEAQRHREAMQPPTPSGVVVAEMPKGKQIGVDLTGEPIYSKQERGDLARPSAGLKDTPRTQVGMFDEQGGLFEAEAAARDQGTAKPAAPVVPAPTPPPTTPPQAPEAKLPKELAGAAPRYGMYQLQFESDIDRAIYITARHKYDAEGKRADSKRDTDYRAWLKAQGIGPTEIRTRAVDIKNAIKREASNAGGDTIIVPKTTRVTAPAPAPVVQPAAPEPAPAPAAPAKKPRDPNAPTLSSVRRKKALAEGNLRAFVAAMGGTKFEHEGKELYEVFGTKSMKPIFGLGPIANGPKSKKGVHWEKAMEAAQQAGFFPGLSMNELGFNDFLEALEQDIGRADSDAKRAVKLERSEEIAAEEEHQGYMDTARQNVEDLGRIGGWQIDQQIREVIENGSTSSTLFAQAGTAAQLAASSLHAAGVIANPDAGEPETQAAIYVLAHDPEAANAFTASVGHAFPDEQRAMEVYQDARDAAKAYVAFVHQALVSGALMDLDALRQVRGYFMFVEERSSGRPISKETVAVLRESGMIEEGQVAPWAHEQMARLATENLRRASQSASDGEFTTFYGVDPFMALGLLSFNASKTMGHEREFATQRWIEKQAQRGSFLHSVLSTNNPVSGALVAWNRNVARNVKGAGLPATVARAEWAYINDVRSTVDAQVANIMHLTGHAIDLLTVGGGPLPQRQRTLLIDVLRSGLFTKMSGADELARRFGEDARPLWPMMVAWTETTDAAGELLVQYGVLTRGQFEAKRSSYVMRGRIDFAEKSIVDRLKEGDVWAALGMAGRDFHQGDVDSGVPIQDPYLLLSRSMSQERNAILWFGLADGIRRKAIGVPHGDMMKADPFTRRHYRTLALNGEALGPNRVRDPINGRVAGDGQLLIAALVSKMRETMASQEDTESGKPLPPGMRPWTQVKQDLFDAILPTDGSPGMAVPEHVFADFALATQTIFDPPEDRTGVYQILNTVMSLARRSWTVFNPVHWMLQRASDVMNNYATGKNHFLDFVSSVLYGRGHYADAHRAVFSFQRWNAAGRPQGQALVDSVFAGRLSMDDYWKGRDFLDFANHVMGGTYTETYLESNAFGMLHGSLLSPDETTRRVAMDIEARGGASANPKGSIIAALEDYFRRHTSLHQRWEDAVIGSLTESQHAAQSKARAVQEVIAMYQTDEIKNRYAAFLAIRERSPGLTAQEAAIAAAEGTGDMRMVNPHVRSFTTRLNAGAGALLGSVYGKAPGSQKAKRLLSNLARLFLHTPFLGWATTMVPTKLRSLMRHPAKSVAALGLVSLLSVGFTRWMTENPDEAARFREAQSANRFTQGQPILSAEEAEMLLRSKTSLTKWLGPTIGSAGERTHSVVWDAMVNVLKLDPVTFKAPGAGPDTYVGSLIDFAPPTDVVLGPAQSLRNASGLTNRDWARGFLQSLQGQIPTIGGAALLMSDRLANPPAGKTSKEQLLIELSDLSKSAAPALYPELFPLSRQGQAAMEMSTLQGRRIEDWVSGVLPAYEQPEGERLGRMIYQALWRSARITPSTTIGDERSVVENLSNELIASHGQPLLPREMENYRDAVRRVVGQWQNVVEGNYATWVRLEHAPGEQLESMIARESALVLDVDLSSGTPVLRSAEQCRSTMGRFIAGQPAELRPYMLEFALKFLGKSGSAWTNAGLPLLMEAATARRVDPSLFAGLYRSSLSDPMGYGLTRFIANKIEADPNVDLNQLWPYFATTNRPPPTLRDQRKLWDETEAKFRFDQTRSAFLQRPLADPSARPPLKDIAPRGSTLLGPAGTLMEPYKGGPGARDFLKERKPQ